MSPPISIFQQQWNSLRQSIPAIEVSSGYGGLIIRKEYAHISHFGTDIVHMVPRPLVRCCLVGFAAIAWVEVDVYFPKWHLLLNRGKYQPTEPHCLWMLEVGTAFTVLILHMERPGELPKSRSEKLCFRPGFAACGPVGEAQLFQTGEITQVNARQAHFGEGADYEGAKGQLVGRDRAGHD